MIKLPPNTSLVLMHIPKTGGTTLHKLLVSHFSKGEFCPERFNQLAKKYSQDELSQYKFFSGHYDRHNVEYIPQQCKVITILREPKSRILSLYYFWKAHKDEIIEKNNLGGPKIAKQLSLLEFLKCQKQGIPANIDNIQVRTLLGKMYVGQNGEYLPNNGQTTLKEQALEKAISYLDSMFAFGILEKYDEAVAYICNLLDIETPKVIPVTRNSKKNYEDKKFEPVEKEEITPEIEKELERLTELDTQLYEYAKNKLDKLLAG